MSLFYTQNISPVISIDERSFNIELKTPLYDVHVAEGGKIISFAGYLLHPITGFDFFVFQNLYSTKLNISIDFSL